MTPAETRAQIAACLARIGTPITDPAVNQASDGPPEPVTAPADIEAKADVECDREERWLGGAA